MNNIAKMIDHTILKAFATKEDVKVLCKEAKEYNFFSVCINPANIELAKKELEGSDVKVCTVIGFPLGANTSEVKAFETKDAIKKGADEVDMVINIGALKDKNYDYVLNDIKAVVDAADKKALVKVIIETCYLTDEEKKIACELSVKAGADFVKTSTGFGTGGSTPEDIKLMREVVGPNIGVKASGGVRNQEDAKAVIEAGCSRIGASASVAITKGEDSQTSGY
ncbi:MAG: deoxyribose-phosphate aldolase [Paeniclostridium sordellii]|uniref:Deoxyribose-phosphate aldolase n=1 Tax=Paeniclostridium hominis TaxID=2764329 RepID=A0ABR7K4M0_9FIRM|nr:MULTISPECIES: deoxyribose-phosphate aldolase [Paeniclostridium]MBC6004036.1 deoxyribose-phosphate aldolase [Paeniclostridium hominis]MBC8630969.1 deoxyribose-phosphate aldolase [[Eubacterium] tenue]MDU1538733.1 deoxyribose-phosphate aldolase [Paeniclostridium sordellii]MDU2592068.1 deoxyribose-phosphate aldolase [Paeniclostridium sordellii]